MRDDRRDYYGHDYGRGSGDERHGANGMDARGGAGEGAVEEIYN